MPSRNAERIFARRSLREGASHLIRQRLQNTENPNPVLVWWDRGGYLETVLEEACRELGDVVLRKEEGLPLSLRRHAPEATDSGAVWYIPEAKKGREWFRDIRAAGGEIQKDIIELAADVYDVPEWDLIGFDVENDELDTVADVLTSELTRARRPSLAELHEHLLTRGHGSPLEHLLVSDWVEGTGGAERVSELRQMLSEEGVPGIEEADDPGALAGKCRKWIVALWLQHAGADPDAFPQAYRLGSSHRARFESLRERISEADATRTAPIYLGQEWWPGVIDGLEDPIALASCPVDAALDTKLWNIWATALKDDDFSGARQLARARIRPLERTYQRSAGAGRIPHLESWAHAAETAEVGLLYESVSEDLHHTDLVELYTRSDEGAWRVDAAVRRLVVSGKPEAKLPEQHPASALLAAARATMVGPRYVEHLEGLAEAMKEIVADGSFFIDTPSVTGFWSKKGHQDDLSAGEEVALIFVDGLRLDLARELAHQLREELRSEPQSDTRRRATSAWVVREHVWRATVPSETETGMGALLPGSVTAFNVDLIGGQLRARRSGRNLSTTYRKELLEREGWLVTHDWDRGWEAPRVALFESDIDEGGEAGIEEIEAHLARRVQVLAQKIGSKIQQGDLKKAYVVTDHGFVLLPPDTTMESLSAPEEAEAVSRRHVAPAGDSDGPGVRLDSEIPGLDYLKTSVRALINPRQRFSKQGLSDRRYFHGGLTPQESILLVLEIERS